MRLVRHAVVGTFVLMLGGCTGFGPATMRHQQADYAAALADAGKRQTLLNIVKLRYGDVPAFVTVNQILAGYSLQGTFSVGTDLLTGGSLRLSDDAQVGVGGTFSNNPTVTYAPVTGTELVRTFLTPLQPADLFALILAGVPAELVLGLGLHSIGGYDNELAAPGVQRAAEPGFADVTTLMLEIHAAGRLGVQLAAGAPNRVVTLRIERPRDAAAPELRLRRLLGLPDERDSFEVVYGLGDAQPGQIVIRTRSLIEVLSQLSGDIDVPEGDVAEGRTYRAIAHGGSALPRVTVRHGRLEPRDAFVAIAYDGDWFWIDNRDLDSKRVFSFVMLLLSLSESSKPGQPPVITIPAG